MTPSAGRLPEGSSPDSTEQTRKAKFSAWFIGEGSLLIQCVLLAMAGGYEVLGVVSADPAVGRWAAENGLRHLRALEDGAAALSVGAFDYLFSVVNLRLLKPSILALPRRGSVNFHDGPLPAYAGLHAPAWALLHGERQHGVTWHEMTERADAGRILKQRLFPIREGATSLELNVQCYEAAIQSFEELLRDLETGRVEPVVQDGRNRSYFARHRRPPGGCILRPDLRASEVSALVRALDFGPYINPLGSPKLLVGGDAVIASRVQPLGVESGAAPGTILELRAETGELVLATASEDVAIDRFRTLDGAPLDLTALAGTYRLAPDDVLDVPGDLVDRLEAADAQVAPHETHWVQRLSSLDPVAVPGAAAGGTGSTRAAVPLDVPADVRGQMAPLDADGRRIRMLAALECSLARIFGRNRFDIGFCDASLRSRVEGVDLFFARYAPFTVALDPGAPLAAALDATAAELARVRQRGLMLRDLVARYPVLGALKGVGPTLGLHVVVDESEDPANYVPADGVRLALVGDAAGLDWHWTYDPRLVAPDTVARLGAQVLLALGTILTDPAVEASAIPAPRTPDAVSRDAAVRRSIHERVEAQAARTPDASAVVAGTERVTYRELNARANRLARQLRARGIGPDTLVGISLERSVNLVVAVLGVLKAGGAYVPLDPAYPADRIRFMTSDADLPVVVTSSKLAPQFPDVPDVIALDAREREPAEEPSGNVEAVGDDARLAYVIYTSGSSGTPKGVMLEHRNVLSFFDAMDECVPSVDGGVWLAVTSLSFDISVLELLWTLTRGFTVVVAPDSGLKSARQSLRPMPARPLDFSLFYFAADEGEPGDRYRLLLEGARFADRHGFSAVWTPERHFHAFGGLYPNPAVTGAAVAAVTERVQIRAGSCVLPLHHPVRVAEEWSVVDNISKGRVGVSVATGWQPNDFILRPENYADRKDAMLRDLEIVRRLWRGETVEYPGPAKGTVKVRIFPRPVQPELPVWLTAAGNPETFAAAGAAGAGVLTHLVGQTLEELKDKIVVYRDARRAAGHDGPGHVVLMLHTFVGADDGQVRELVRKPLSDYLRTSINLIRPFASTFPTFRNQTAAGKSADEVFASLTPEDLDALVAHSLDRYVETGGLFGTPETCLRMIAQMKESGVDEVACLIDFGVPTDAVLSHLRDLDRLRELANAPQDEAEAPDTIPALIARHGVTHLQCTPSMATMLLLDSDAAAGLGRLKALLVGGEAFPAALARRLRQASDAAILNMYGPTETTVWSATHRLDEIGESIPIGGPIAGTELLVLDDNRAPVRAGEIGELYIGGPGVARGYLNRDALTRDRFVPHPSSDVPGARVYKTGDLVRVRDDGALEFLGRADFQVKVRGHRIELGEIEAALATHPAVREAVVAAREDSTGDKRLVAYIVPVNGDAPTSEALRNYLAQRLPDFMVPSHVMTLEAFPHTPNNKIDRAALPSPFARAAADLAEPAQGGADASSIEAQIAGVWSDVLKVSRVGSDQNFFDLGGHSLLAAQVLARLKHLDPSLSLTDLFRYPTINSLAAHLARKGSPAVPAQAPAAPRDRAAMRQAFIAKRQEQRRGRTDTGR